MKKRSIALLLITCLSIPSWAVMPYYTGARAEGMGGAFTSLSGENSSLFYNPAGLADIEKKEISAMYWKDYFGTGYSFLSCGLPADEWGGISFGWAKTDNTFEKTDTWGRVTGTGEVSNDIFMAGAGYRKGLPFSLGVTAKFISEKIDAFSVSGWGVDLGGVMEVRSFRFGLSVQNAVSGGLNGNSVAGGSVSEKLPSTLRFGCSLTNRKNCSMDPVSGKCEEKPENLALQYTFAADVSVPSDRSEDYELSPGAEIWLNNTVAARAGFRNLKDYTAGLSFQLSGFRLDYAFVISKELENNHIFSTSIFFK